MVRRIGGARRKSRSKFKKHYQQRGKISLRRFFQRFDAGEHVALVAEPAYQKGMYRARFHGKAGTIQGMRGRAYEVMIHDGNKEKTLLVHPVHLKKV